MIYIEEKSFKRQLDLIKYFNERGNYELIIWMYPESGLNSILSGPLLSNDDLGDEPVTTYAEPCEVRRSERLKLNSSLIHFLEKSQETIAKNCDSLAIYENKNPKWVACSVGHEGMSLVREDGLFPELSLNFNASHQAPDWW